jgi:hypothetical protein
VPGKFVGERPGQPPMTPFTRTQCLDDHSGNSGRSLGATIGEFILRNRH